MTTTILDGETYTEALQRRYAEEAKTDERMNIIELAKEAGGVADDQTIVLFHEELEAVARVIRAEALEEAAKVCEAKQSYNAMHANTDFAAAIRGLK